MACFDTTRTSGALPGDAMAAVRRPATAEIPSDGSDVWRRPSKRLNGTAGAATGRSFHRSKVDIKGQEIRRASEDRTDQPQTLVKRSRSNARSIRSWPRWPALGFGIDMPRTRYTLD